MGSKPSQNLEPTNRLSIPALPTNVTIFSPSKPLSAKSLLNGHIFTRLSLSSNASPSPLSALEKDKRLAEDYSLLHGNTVLVFDSEAEGKDLQDAHHDHFRAVCLALKDHDIALNVASCVHDATTALQAGFQFDEMKEGSILVIDLMNQDGDEDDSDDDAEIQMMTVDEDVEATKP